MFAAVGWPGQPRRAGAGSAGVTHDERMIPVDEYLRTNVEHIFAVGDVNGRSKLVQSARSRAGPRMERRPRADPPPTHESCPARASPIRSTAPSGSPNPRPPEDHEIAVGIAHYDDLLRPVADGRPDGFCKLIVDRASQRSSAPTSSASTPPRPSRSWPPRWRRHDRRPSSPTCSSPSPPIPKRSAWRPRKCVASSASVISRLPGAT